MKLHKLMYFSYGECLAKLNFSLTQEKFQAWKYGCVMPSVYEFFRSYGKNSIGTFGLDTEGRRRVFSEDSNIEIYRIINNVIRRYINFQDFTLSRINHRKEGAWYKTRKESGDKAEIPLSYIKEEFE